MACRSEILAIIAKVEKLAEMAATLDNPVIDLLLTNARTELQNLLSRSGG